MNGRLALHLPYNLVGDLEVAHTYMSIKVSSLGVGGWEGLGMPHEVRMGLWS